MKYVLNLSLALRSSFTLSLALLAACSSVQPKLPEANPTTHTHSLSVDIDASSRQADIEARYGGDVVVWRPEAGFAVLGLSGEETLSTQNLEGAAVEPSRDEVAAPEAEVEASSVWGEGREVWSGGREVWSGGIDIASEPTLSWQNADAWRQIDLKDGFSLTPHRGSGIKVAVIDSGLDLNHPAFTNRLAPESEWKDFVDGDAYPQEERSEDGDNGNYGHGTGVAGVVLQVAPSATILPLRVLDSEGLGDITDVAAAIDHAVASGADVINLSLGTDEDSDALNRMISYAAEQKVFVIASSGNTGDKEITYPARNAKQPGRVGDYLLSVGSAKTYWGVLSVLSTFSTYGKTLEVTAPGEYIYTAFPDDQVGYWSGTSFSAPMVSGTLALLLGEDKEDEKTIAGRLDWLLSDVDLSYSPLNVRAFAEWAFGESD